jgi:putative ABC transport system permease protein
MYFPDDGAVGKQIRLETHDEGPNANAPSTSGESQLLEIVGVVADSRQIASRQVHDLYDPVSPEIDAPLQQHPGAGREMAILVKTQSKAAAFADRVRREVLAIDEEQPIYDVQTLQALADVALGPARLCLLILGIFAATALLTACVGLYAIVSHSVARRTNEIGVRMALGAAQWDVLRLVARDALPVIAAGLGVGLFASLGLTRLMSNLLYGVPPNDPATLLAVAVVLTATGALAIYIPARRATRIDPMVALRYE